MRGVALSDLHLGFRAFSAKRDNRNGREVDVEYAWNYAVDRIVNVHRPDLVTIAGDVFHHPRVSDYAKRAFLRGTRAIVRNTTAHIIVLGGNHDAAKTEEVLTPIALAEGWDQRIHVVTKHTRVRVMVGGEVISVACFPYVDRAGGQNYRLAPDPEASVNVLCMHAAVKGDASGDKLPFFYGASEQSLDIAREVDKWDVIHCGDYHEFTRLHDTALAFYSGAIERTSNNIWAETQPKGVIVYDTEQKTLMMDEIRVRPMVDLGFAGEPSAEALNETLASIDGMYEDKIVRLKVEDFPKEERQHIDWARVRKLKSECFHFYLDIRYRKVEVADLSDRRDGTTISLADEFVAFFEDDAEDVRDCALLYMDFHADVEDAEEAQV